MCVFFWTALRGSQNSSVTLSQVINRILEYGPETKHQIREWHTANSSRPKKARMSKSQIKTMLIFFDSQGMVQKEFVPPGQTVNQIIWRDQVKVGLINLRKGLFSLNAHIYYKLKSGT